MVTLPKYMASGVSRLELKECFLRFATLREAPGLGDLFDGDFGAHVAMDGWSPRP